jgi:hypothetical protein
VSCCRQEGKGGKGGKGEKGSWIAEIVERSDWYGEDPGTECGLRMEALESRTER